MTRGTWILLVMMGTIAISGCRRRQPAPLAPGETVCTTKSGLFGATRTHCKTGQPAVEQSAAWPDSDGARWWCTSALPDVGWCAITQIECEHDRGGFEARGHVYTPCEPAARAACFRRDRSGDANAPMLNCSPTLAGCNAVRDFTLANPGEPHPVSGECIVM